MNLVEEERYSIPVLKVKLDVLSNQCKLLIIWDNWYAVGSFYCPQMRREDPLFLL